jgi:ATP-dependent DNA ligase
MARFVCNARGDELFAAACARGLEGIVAKWKQGRYGAEPLWVKIKNPAYSQIQGRHEQFDKMRKRAATAGK